MRLCLKFCRLVPDVDLNTDITLEDTVSAKEDEHDDKSKKLYVSMNTYYKYKAE